MYNLPVSIKKLLSLSLPVAILLSFLTVKQGAIKADSFLTEAYYVRYEEGQRETAVREIERFGGVVDHDLSRWNLLAVSIPTASSKQLNQVSSIIFNEPIPEYEVAGEDYPFGLDMVQALDVWDFDRDKVADTGAPTGNGVKVCIIDTGVFDSHKDFDSLSISGFSQIEGEVWSDSANGHGTHVAGTVAAGMQGEGLVGVAPQADLFIVKVYDRNGSWIDGQSNIGAAAATCAENGANIINLSLKGGKSVEEERIFSSLYEQDGILIIAAAGNDGSSSDSEDEPVYPASYEYVISVAAISSNLTHSSYSNENSEVELAAPGSAVISTWPTPENGSVPFGNVFDGQTNHPGIYIEQSTPGIKSGTLVDGGLCREEDKSDNWNSNVVLCQREDLFFRIMVGNSESQGAVATIIAWKEEGLMAGTLASGTSTGPVVMVGRETGDFLRNNKIGQIVTVETRDGSDYLEGPGGYRAMGGTSMASPHVAGAAALVWSACSDLTNQELRQLLDKTALDLGAPDRDISYGFGLVQAFDAWHHCRPADLGDLPRSYGQARHSGDGQLRLGSLWTADSWQGPYPGEGHDDQSDNGISISPLEAGEEATVIVQAQGDAQSPRIVGWLDYNQDGQFNSQEQIINSFVNLNSVTALTFTNPITPDFNLPINYRFRLYDETIQPLRNSQSSIYPLTMNGGEVEDGYALTVPTAIFVKGFSAASLHGRKVFLLLLVLFLSLSFLTGAVRLRRSHRKNKTQITQQAAIWLQPVGSGSH